jgi:hypothetical protein
VVGEVLVQGRAKESPSRLKASLISLLLLLHLLLLFQAHVLHHHHLLL